MKDTYSDDTKKLGMWIFLAMEVLFFGGIFFLYLNERHFYPQAFADGSRLFNLKAGTLNTALLLTSSLSMALAIEFMKKQHVRRALVSIGLTAFLGICFLGVKYYEFSEDFGHSLLPGIRFVLPIGQPKEVHLFFNLYLFAVSLHALHLLIGISWTLTLAFLIWQASRKKNLDTPDWTVRTEVAGLYWHFVDIIWIFLFPLFYLVGSRS
jgi:cytochrome c oxidase subunit 3